VGHGAACCATNNQVDTQTCNTDKCPVNCVGSWSAWTSCSCDCGGGISTRTFQITTPCVGSGTPCVGADGQKETMSCNTPLCPKDCVGAWSAWTGCSVPCGGGSSSRTFHVTSPAVGGGKCCAVDDLETQCVSCNAIPCPLSNNGTCDWEWTCSASGTDNQYGVPQCCFQYKCRTPHPPQQPQCGWKPQCSAALSENSANADCEWNWSCPPTLSKPPCCAWRWLCQKSSGSAECSCAFDYYCGDVH